MSVRNESRTFKDFDMYGCGDSKATYHDGRHGHFNLQLDEERHGMSREVRQRLETSRGISRREQDRDGVKRMSVIK